MLALYPLSTLLIAAIQRCRRLVEIDGLTSIGDKYLHRLRVEQNVRQTERNEVKAERLSLLIFAILITPVSSVFSRLRA